MPALVLDNDALLKLCAYGLFDEALEAFRVSYDDVYILPTAKYSLLPVNSRLKRCKDEATALRLESVFAQAKIIDDKAVDSEQLDSLLSFPGIDAGEALLIAYTYQHDGAILLTGDKRAVAALSSTDELGDIASKLSEKICVLEVLFKFLINADFKKTQEFVRLKPDVDKAMKNIFGANSPASIESVQQGLDSYINHLRQHTGNLVLITLI